MKNQLGALLLIMIPVTAWPLDIGSFLGPQKYKMYDCTGGTKTNSRPQQDCTRELSGTAVFKVEKKKSEVFIAITLKDGQKHLLPLTNCKVFDEKNWSCGGKEERSSGSGWSLFSRDYKYQMVDGDVSVTDFYSSSQGGAVPSYIEYTVGFKFVKN